MTNNDDLIKKFESMLTKNNSVIIQQAEEIVKNESKVILNLVESTTLIKFYTYLKF